MSNQDLILKIPLFQNIDQRTIDELSSISTVKKFAKGMIILFEEDSCRHFFLILSGEVKIFSASDQGREYVLSSLRKNQYFGEVSLATQNTNFMSFIAVRDTEALIFPANEFAKVLNRNPVLLGSILQSVMQKYRDTVNQLKSFSLDKSEARIANLMVKMAKEKGTKVDDGSLVFRRPTHYEIAARVGATRETVSRMLKILEKKGLIRIVGKKVYLLLKSN